MERYLIAVRSMTYAMKGAGVLGANDIPAEVVRLAADATKRGCAYGIAVNAEQRHAATRLLTRVRIPYSEVVREEKQL